MEARAKWNTVFSQLGIPFTQRSTGVYIILCPFHKERTPSLHCWPDSGNFRCHGCHRHGSIEEFAERYGVPLDRLRAHYDDPRQLKLNL